ncbi:MAG TPA: UDP-N-acetylmuramate--L-alanine ligase [Bacteroidia bacterium]|nr:UDP-N-acetylmuramate--L-alanine ligase [Bacteroidia bacterium]
MNLNKIHSVYFLGIGGIGMSALARYFNAMGKRVAGYDKTSTKLTDELIAEGIEIHFEDHIRNIPKYIKELPYDIDNILIVFTPAVPLDHSEYVFFNLNGFNIKKRAEVLGMITESAHTIAVAGTHGKTTTSSLTAHILKSAGLDPSAFLGGITQNYNTNLLLSSKLKNSQLRTPDSELIVVEADEYDRSFLTLHPEIAVITSVDADHLDIYGDKNHVEESFSLFANQVKSKLILKKSIVGKVKAEVKTITYAVNDESADYFAKDIVIENGFYKYSIVTPITIFENLTLGLPGLHNVENSVAAVAIACELNISADVISKALASFKGVKRRFDYHIKTDKLVFIDDYAHHPEELKAAISSAKEMYPGKKITGIFQPHLFSRTRDFADDFARSLDLLDECILMEIYPARESPIEGVSSQMLLNKMKSANKSICQKNDLIEEVGKREIEVLMTMGAGDIDTFVESIKNELNKH